MKTRNGYTEGYRTTGPSRAFGMAFLILCMMGAAIAAHAGRGKQDLIVLIPGETVYLEIIQNTVRSQPGFSWTDSGHNDRFFKFGRALEDAFAKRKVPLKVEVVVFGTRIPAGATKVRLALIRWNRNAMGEIETRFSAELIKQGSKANLGVFVGVEDQLTVGGAMLERQYQEAAVKAAGKFADRMNLQINF